MNVFEEELSPMPSVNSPIVSHLRLYILDPRSLASTQGTARWITIGPKVTYYPGEHWEFMRTRFGIPISRGAAATFQDARPVSELRVTLQRLSSGGANESRGIDSLDQKELRSKLGYLYQTLLAFANYGIPCFLSTVTPDDLTLSSIAPPDNGPVQNLERLHQRLQYLLNLQQRMGSSETSTSEPCVGLEELAGGSDQSGE